MVPVLAWWMMNSAVEIRPAVRVTAGLNPAAYLETPLADLLDRQASYNELLSRLHPDGLRCSCGSVDRISHGRNRTGYPVYKCRDCGSVYFILSGTVFSGCTMEAHRLVLFMRLLAAGQKPAEIGRAVGLHRNSVAQLMAKVSVYSRHGGD